MKIRIGTNTAEVQREKGDKWLGESALLHAINIAAPIQRNQKGRTTNKLTAFITKR